MTVEAIAKQYVAMCNEGKFSEILDLLFAPNAVSVEAFAPPGAGSRESVGLPAIHEKGKWWGENHTVHSARVTGPYPNGNRFAVRFEFDVTNKPSGKRMQMDEIGLFTVENGKITREEFFYTAG
jgi:ketosteroid isomerase-like protein